jgi:AraC-like DNA-binding protein
MRLMEASAGLFRRNRGRPRGVPVRVLDDYVAEFEAFKSKYGRLPKSDDEFANFAGTSRSTLHRNLKSFGTSWSQFRRQHA